LCAFSLFAASIRAISCVPFIERKRLTSSGFLKDLDPCFKIVCNVCGCLLLRDAFGLNIDQGLPETRSPDGKPDEPGNARRCLQPLLDPVSRCTASQHNETHGVPSTTPSHLHHLDSIFLAIKPFDLPDIRLHPSVLQGLHGLHH
jgi:hypothetical protein